MSRHDKLLAMLEKDPLDPFLHFGVAMELVKEGRQDEAIARFDRTIELDPAYTAAHYHKGNTLIGIGKGEEARAVLTAGIEKARCTGDAHTAGEMQDLLDTIG